MLAFKILQKLTKRAQQPKAKLQQPSSALGQFNLEFNPNMAQILLDLDKNPSRNSRVSVEFSGDLPTASSELAQKITSVGTAYGLSNAFLEKRTNPKLGSHGSDVPSVLGISIGSWFISNFLQYYVFDAILGTHVPKTKIEINVDSMADLDRNNVLKDHKVNQNVSDAVAGLARANFVDQTFDFFEFFANAYHGYYRHDKSILAGLGWGFFGNVGMALQQGYGLLMEGEGSDKSSDMPRFVPIQNPRSKRRKATTTKKVSARKVRAKKSSKASHKSTRKSRKAK